MKVNKTQNTKKTQKTNLEDKKNHVGKNPINM